ncbi:hypothetical protein BGW42_008218, partial [Actinomortierella wolfii]
MAIVGAFGPPDYFITFTANEHWPEVIRETLPGQSAESRFILIDRVFKIKLD